MPVNQTVKPLVAMVLRFMNANLLRKSRGTIPTRTYSGKEYAGPDYRLWNESRKVRNSAHFFLVKIVRRVIPGIDPGRIHSSCTDRNDQIMDAGPEGRVASGESHAFVFAGEISPDVRVGVDDGPQAPARLLGPVQGVQERLRVHHVAVALRPGAGRGAVRGAGDVPDGLEAADPGSILDQEAAAFGRVSGLRVADDVLQGFRGDHGAGM